MTQNLIISPLLSYSFCTGQRARNLSCKTLAGHLEPLSEQLYVYASLLYFLTAHGLTRHKASQLSSKTLIHFSSPYLWMCKCFAAWTKLLFNTSLVNNLDNVFFLKYVFMSLSTLTHELSVTYCVHGNAYTEMVRYIYCHQSFQ